MVYNSENRACVKGIVKDNKSLLSQDQSKKTISISYSLLYVWLKFFLNVSGFIVHFFQLHLQIILMIHLDFLSVFNRVPVRTIALIKPVSVYIRYADWVCAIGYGADKYFVSAHSRSIYF